MAITSPPQHRWTLADALETYGIRNWGNAVLRHQRQGPRLRPPGRSAGRQHGPEGAGGRGAPPGHRPAAAHPLHRRAAPPGASTSTRPSSKAIAEHNYKGQYRGVYPIKVNQHRYVVETIVETGKQYGYGLEAGQQAGAARGDGAAGQRGRARHLQRLQGRGVRRDGAVRLPPGPQGDPGGGEAHRAAADRRGGARARASRPRIGMRVQPVHARRGQVGGLGRRPLQVRPLLLAS